MSPATDPGPAAAAAARADRERALAIAVTLLLGTAALYSRTLGHEFVRFDDFDYIVDNPMVRGGLSLSGLRWAFTSFYEANWHPLTWLSHMLDVELFGIDPRGHHLVGVLLHATNAVLLFAALRAATRATWSSGLVAALFALHPLRVESVAWAAERKDLLAGLFWMLALLAHAAHARRPSTGRRVLVALALALGLLSKPMLVTLPLVLLLLDVWPLDRLRRQGAGAASLLLEKLPLLALALLSGVATLAAQRSGGAVQDLAGLPLAVRLANALSAYGVYLWQTIRPSGLAFYYPHPWLVEREPWAALALPALLSAAVLATVSVVAWRARGRRPYLAVGWLWFLLTLLPVIGVMQVGNQAHADRYAYLPLVGVYIMAAWGLRELATARPALRPALVGISLLALAALAAATWTQQGYWRDSRTLFSRALEVTSGNYVAHNNLGNEALRGGDPASAAAHYRAALAIRPGLAEARNGLGAALARAGNHAGAIAEYREALRLRPDYVEARFNLGLNLEAAGDPDLARAEYERALELRPGLLEALLRLAALDANAGHARAAIERYRRALELRPDSVPAAAGLSWVLATARDDAVRDGTEALRLARDCARRTDHRDPAVLDALAAAHAEQRDFDRAVEWQTRAIELAGEDARAELASRLGLYRDGKPYRVAATPGYTPEPSRP